MTDLYSIIHGATDRADLLDRLDREGLAIVEADDVYSHFTLDEALEWETSYPQGQPVATINIRDTVKNLEKRGYIIGTRLR